MIRHFHVHHWCKGRLGLHSYLTHGLLIVKVNWQHQQRIWQEHRSNSPHQFCHMLHGAIMHREGQFCHQIIKSWQLPTRVGVVTHTLRPTIQISNYNSRTIIQSTGNIYLLSLFEIFTYSLNCTLIFLFSASIGPVLLFLNKLSLKFSLWQQAPDEEIILLEIPRLWLTSLTMILSLENIFCKSFLHNPFNKFQLDCWYHISGV